ncbi:hypothetical protein HPB48_008472 [Haemaphysalis longicornis]|uniref:Ig-like domain-containing protein n=1 Tax=Haemaphysalis longicornis TaxID=44386 RepID=A0A9J6FMB1_HAELO|nr:hypothetical protein HPB48_008472 [Haemaphysalis longicornis]
MASLTILEVGAEDIGNYTCVVSNKAGKDSFTSALLVNGKSPKLQPFSFPKELQLNKKVVVHCTALEGDEPFKFAWYKGSMPVVTSHKVNVRALSESVTSLTILELTAEDIGNYTCEAVNNVGVDRVSAELLVKGTSKNMHR